MVYSIHGASIVTLDANSTSRFARAVERFDKANSEDPTRERVAGSDRPKALVYAERMSARLRQFAPEAPEVVQLAARSQHIRRWTVERGTYPEGRDGYRRWRTDLARFHADTAGAILQEVGYDAATIGRVQALLRKEQLKTDPDVQLLEDVACLVFLEHYLDDFSRQHAREKVLDVIRKTWTKMSARGRKAAPTVNLTPPVRALLSEAIDALPPF